MARLNTKKAPRKVLNLAGGQAYSESAKLELASLVLASMVNDQFYRSKHDSVARLRELVAETGPEFASRAAVYARREHGLRSISHVIAGELSDITEWPEKRAFYRNVVRRPDDITEILACAQNGHSKFPKAMQRGLADAFGQFDTYQLAKYRGEGKGWKLVDAVNILHPKPTRRNAEGLAGLVNGTLASTETWEAKLSAAGQTEEAEESKGEAWKGLLLSGKLPYFALLRNLNNILEQAPDLVPEALNQLIDEKAIRRSLVLPFRYLSAARAVAGKPGSGSILSALAVAAEKSLANVPVFPGRTLVALDDSASMKSPVAGRGDDRVDCFLVGAMFTAALARKADTDVMLFSDIARHVSLNPDADLFGLISQLGEKRRNQGTNVRAVFEKAIVPYDRIIILSDMQSWMGYKTPKAEYKEYCKRTGADPAIFSFDLAGYGTLQFPEKKVYALGGFSEKALNVMAMLEEDRHALIHQIEAVTFA